MFVALFVSLNYWPHKYIFSFFICQSACDANVGHFVVVTFCSFFAILAHCKVVNFNFNCFVVRLLSMCIVTKVITL